MNMPICMNSKDGKINKTPKIIVVMPVCKAESTHRKSCDEVMSTRVIDEIMVHNNPSNTQPSIKAFGAQHPHLSKGKSVMSQSLALGLLRNGENGMATASSTVSKRHLGRGDGLVKTQDEIIAKQVRRIVCEWRERHVSLHGITRHLKANGFRLHSIVEQDEKGGVVVFDNKCILGEG